MEINENYNRRSGLRRYLANPNEAGYNISWGPILAGVVTFLALLITLSLIGSAIGFGQVDATTNHSLDGVGTGLLIWTIVSFILSLAGAGFISGLTARRVGVVHGFLTWASGLLVLVFMLSILTTEITTAGKEIALNPDNSEQIIDETVNSLQKRIETIAEATNDKEAIDNAITNNTDLT